ncbi:MAG: 30S ribosomal protein S4 [Deltaproteobacteria bacterium]|nr:30S ribosomal protein S4 [Deltaproteobacteria bacterium]
MARYTGPSCRICRREGSKLFLKGNRCLVGKCAYDRRSTPPGQHGARRSGKLSDYGQQLREKQKVKRSYGLQEKQFRALFDKAERQKGMTGGNLLILLERRLDNIVYRLGFANSRAQARQLVSHGHFEVNLRKVNIPSYLIKPGDSISLRQKSRKIQLVLESIETVGRRGVPAWLNLDRIAFSGTVVALPTRADISSTVNEQLIVEHYSR